MSELICLSKQINQHLLFPCRWLLGVQLAAAMYKEAKVHKTHCKLIFKLIMLDYCLNSNSLQHFPNDLEYVFIFKGINCINLTAEDSSQLWIVKASATGRRSSPKYLNFHLLWLMCHTFFPSRLSDSSKLTVRCELFVSQDGGTEIYFFSYIQLL